MKKLALLGASGHGKVVADAARAMGWADIVFFDDAWPEKQTNGEWLIAGNSLALREQASAFDAVVVAIGDGAVRWRLHCDLRQRGMSMATIVHPGAWISPSAKLAAGTVVMAGAVVQADVAIGEACIINTAATVDHDCALSHGVHIAPGAHLSGNVCVGALSWVGVGACVKQGVRIGQSTMVGAGAVVVSNVPDESTWVGNPARSLKI